MNLKKGFTLIELLVVVAIIGILASVVLASLNTARDKGADAAVKANLSGMRAQSEISYDDDGSYVNACADSAAAVTAAGATCHDGAAGWAAEAQLSDNSYWCVDHTGASEGQASSSIGAADFVCG